MIPNVMAKVKDKKLFGEDILSARDLSGVAFKRPFDKVFIAL